MSIQLDPAELGFRRPFTQEVTETLRLRNPNSDPVAFKVKTTAPKQYCVRPNSGRIEGGQQVEVQVLLQAMKEDPPADAKCRDKFLVQSVAVPANADFTNVATLWSSVEQTAKSSIQEKKIRVLFLPASGSAAPLAAAVDSTPSRRTTMGPDDEYGSPMSNANTPAQKSVAPAGPVSRPESKPDNERRGYEDAKASSANAANAVAGAASSAATTVSNSVPKDSDELRRQLATAQAQIAQLKDDAAAGLRQRKAEVQRGEKTVPQAAAQAVRDAPAGVPVALVAALCLLSFLLAYFMF